jgi:hypothetical protein
MEKLEYHRRSFGHMRSLKNLPSRIIGIDGERSIDEISEKIQEISATAR